MKLKISNQTTITIGQSLSGFIFDDDRGKFADGDFVRTSSVVEITEDGILTKNSKYKIERVSQEEILHLVMSDQ